MMRAILLLAMLVGAWFCAPAHATVTWCTGSPNVCDEGEAFMAAVSAANKDGPVMCKTIGTPTTTYTGHNVTRSGNDSFLAGIKCSNGSNSANVGTSYFVVGKTCSARQATYPPGDKTGSAVPIPRCYGGCQVLGNETKYSQQGGVSLYSMSNRYYSGQTCTSGIDANAPIDAQRERDKAIPESTPECTALGNGQTACVKPNGDYCATASTGATFCWTPTEEGAKVNGEQAQRKSEVDKPVTPPEVSIPDKDWQRKEGHQSQACINNNCKTYNVTNYSAVAKGTAKNSTGNNNADGSGNTTGKGTGSGSGTGTGDGEGEGNSAGVGECGAPMTCSGDAIMCAQLKETHLSRCEASDFRSGFINEINGADTSDGTGTVDAETLWGTADEGELEFDSSGLGWGTSCPAPPEVFGKPMDFAALCNFASMLGLLILAIAHLHALYIFMGD